MEGLREGLGLRVEGLGDSQSVAQKGLGFTNCFFVGGPGGGGGWGGIRF